MAHTGAGYSMDMGYELQRDETIADGVRRIAHEQLDNAFESFGETGSGDVEEAVHDIRKRCKKLRGLVRLVRPGMEDTYQRANTTFRDAARELSPIRDAHALLETFDDLLTAHAGQVPEGGVAAVRGALVRRADAASAAVREQQGRIERAAELMEAERSRVDDWPVPDSFDAIAAGVAKTYKRGRKGLGRSVASPTTEHFHEWRKRAKYSWYHVRLLHQSARSVLDPLASVLHDLSDALGDDHDLAVLGEQLEAGPDEFGGHDQIDAARLLLEGRRADLQRRAVSLGSRLYVEEPEVFAERLGGYWEVWQDLGDELEAGEIEDLAEAADELEDRTKAELYERAQRLDIDGRSTMGRRALMMAIRAAGG